MNKHFILSIALILSLLTGIPALAGNSNSQKERLAILDFTAGNCPEHVARVLTDMASAKMFETEVFTLIERDQIKKVFNELELQQTGCAESECAVTVGKLLTANKIIIGKLYKIDRYVIVLKIINVADGSIAGSYRAEAESEQGIESALMGIIEKIVIKNKKDLFISYSISAGYRKALGEFSNISDDGFGTSLNLYINNFYFKDAILLCTFGFYYFDGANPSIESVMMVPVLFCIGYQYHISRFFKIASFIGGGYLVNFMNYDRDGIDQFGEYEYSVDRYYDKTVTAGFDFDIVVYPAVHLMVSPGYIYFFEKESTGQLFGIDAGVKMFF